MSRTSYILNMAACTVLLFASIACKKEPLNPTPENLPAQEFQLSITEVRQTRTYNWEVTPGASGTCTLDNHEEAITQLNVTAYNTVTLSTTADVNAESSNPSAVAVTKVSEGNNRSYMLTYKSDGVATIKLYNGTGTGTVSQTFSVKGIEYVPLEGILFTYGGQPLEIRRSTTSRPPLYCKFPEDEDAENYDKPRPSTTDFSIVPYVKPDIWRDGPGENEVERHNNGGFVPDPDAGTLLTFDGLIPENTSFRTVESFESEWECYPNELEKMIHYGYVERGEYDGLWPNVYENPKDVSEYIGAKMWIAPINDQYYMACLKFNAPGTKYFYLYHAQEDYVKPKPNS